MKQEPPAKYVMRFMMRQLLVPLAAFHTVGARYVALFVAITTLANPTAFAATRTWTGGSTVNNNWTASANWGGTAPLTGDTLTFAGTTRTSSTNTFVADTRFAGIRFTNTTAGQSFTFISAGNRLILGGDISTSASSSAGISDAINFAMLLSGNRTITTGDLHHLTVGGIISDGGSGFGVTKLGTGTLTLSGVNTFSGATTISAGKLVGVTGGSCSNSAMNIHNTTGSTLGVSVTQNSQPWVCQNLTFGGVNAALAVEFGDVIPSSLLAPLQVNGDVIFTGTPTVTVTGTAIPILLTTYPLMTWTGAANPANTPTSVTLPPPWAGNLSLSSDGRTLNLNITYIPPVSLVYPTNQSTSYQTIPYLKWADVVNSPYAGFYEIQISTSSDFSGVVDEDVVPAMINHYVPAKELPENTYYWRVRYRDAAGAAMNWSSAWSFSIQNMIEVVIVPLGADWNLIQSKLEYALAHSPSELRFQPGIYNITTDPADTALFYIQNSGNILINGQGCTFLISDTSGQTTPLFYGRNSTGPIQFKNFTVDYTADSLAHVAGKVTNIEKFTYPDCAFTIQVDPAVYPSLDDTLLNNTLDGLVLEADTHHRQRWHALQADPRLAVNETWAQAKQAAIAAQGTNQIPNTYRFTPKSNKGAFFNHLELDDWWVGSYRGGDLFYAYSDCPDLVINNVVSRACRGRAVIPRSKCDRLRVVNNQFLCTGGRVLGMTSGGINDHSLAPPAPGYEPWWEGNTLEYNADDMYNGGTDQCVFRNNMLRGPFRHAIWLHYNRQWVEGNTVYYAGITGLSLDPGGLEVPVCRVVNVGLIKNNILIQPRLGGIIMETDLSLALDESGSPYHTDIRIEGNVIQDVLENEAIRVNDGQRVELLNNRIITTGIPFSDVADPAMAMGIHVLNSADVLIRDNEVSDSRLATTNRIVVDASANNVVLLNNTYATGYQTWANINGLVYGPDGDDDGDGLNNLGELAFGGDPKDSGDTGYSVSYSITKTLGNQWFNISYPRLSDPNSGIEYFPEVTSSLTNGSWTTSGVEHVQTVANGFATGIDSVTVRVTVGDKDRQFIRVRVRMP